MRPPEGGEETHIGPDTEDTVSEGHAMGLLPPPLGATPPKHGPRRAAALASPRERGRLPQGAAP